MRTDERFARAEDAENDGRGGDSVVAAVILRSLDFCCFWHAQLYKVGRQEGKEKKEPRSSKAFNYNS
jgi:hypothetical protein